MQCSSLSDLRLPIDRYVGWKGNNLENNPDGVKEMLQPLEHNTALCWYWGADCMEIMNTFTVQVGLTKVYYERFVSI